MVEDRRKSVCPKTSKESKCASAIKELNKALRRNVLQLECDEFPWGSSEQGGEWLPESQRRTECVTSFQNNWHGSCVSRCLIFFIYPYLDYFGI